MQGTDWRISGDWIKNCNCAFGCSCDFLAPPTHGKCQAIAGMRIAQGHFGTTQLDGLSFFAVVEFPGPLHEGNGILQAVIDERQRQSNAMPCFKSYPASMPRRARFSISSA